VSVQDTGMGISEKNQRKLFKLFGFIDETEEKNTNGIGLGLMISDKLVTEFGGKFDLDSEEGVGSTFKFTVKLENQKDIEKKAKQGSGEQHADSHDLMFDWVPKTKQSYGVRYYYT
jgi:signal transduction histidine kinase